MSLGTLSVDLEARFAKFEEGLAKAERIAEQRAAKISKAMERVGTVATSLAGALAGAFSFGAFTAWVDRTAQGLNQLNDAVDATGAGFEKISALDDLARRTGTPFETATGILIKFNAELAKATPGSATEQVLASIGLQAEELRRLDPADALQKVAVALRGYANDGDKARLVQDLFGKSVREAAPFLNDLAEAGTLVATTTKEQAEAADQYLKNVARLEANLQNLSRTILGNVLPALNEMMERFEKRGVIGTFADDIRIKFNEGLAQIASERIGDNSNQLAKLLAIPEGDRSFYTRNEIFRLRSEIRELQADAQAATGVVKRLTNGGEDPKAPPKPSDKAFIFGAEGYGDLPKVKPRTEGADPTIVPRIEQAAAIKLISTKPTGADAALKDAQAFFEQQERRLEQAARFGEQLQLQTADLNASLIADDRARGEAQIEIDRQVLQKQLNSLQVYGADRERLQAQLDENIAARQRALEEQLKPAWQRMVENWDDNTRHMAESYETLMDGVVARTEDALTNMIRNGKLSLSDLADFVQDTIARIIAQKAVAKLFEIADVVFGGGLGGGFAKGAAFQGGSVVPFANGGVVGTPTYFPMSGRRTGLMGEAGPEAIMPLKRGPDGKLGVQASAPAAGPTFVFNIASGVTSAELAAMVPQLKAQLKAELLASQRRPGYGV